ncbi:hypothetical protein B0H14DRAFT_3448693 [Mycena olivaceomarginata]|nr:hypothetical protein B0H14DRAFT_3448693 [Mycena olivaceomarginata]
MGDMNVISTTDTHGIGVSALDEAGRLLGYQHPGLKYSDTWGDYRGVREPYKHSRSAARRVLDVACEREVHGKACWMSVDRDGGNSIQPLTSVAGTSTLIWSIECVPLLPSLLSSPSLRLPRHRRRHPAHPARTPPHLHRIPDFIASRAPDVDVGGDPNATAPLDLIFVDFFGAQLIRTLNAMQTACVYSRADARVYNPRRLNEVLGVELIMIHGGGRRS